MKIKLFEDFIEDIMKPSANPNNNISNRFIKIATSLSIELTTSDLRTLVVDATSYAKSNEKDDLTDEDIMNLFRAHFPDSGDGLCESEDPLSLSGQILKLAEQAFDRETSSEIEPNFGSPYSYVAGKDEFLKALAKSLKEKGISDLYARAQSYGDYVSNKVLGSEKPQYMSFKEYMNKEMFK